MSEGLRKKIIFIALGLAIVFGAYNFWPTEDKTVVVEQSTTIKTTAVTAPLVQATRTNLIDIKKLEPLAWGEDPFRGVMINNRPVAAGNISWVLSGIIYNAKRPVAIINNQAVGIGDEINRAEVVTIGRKEVTLKYGDREITLKVTKS